MIKTKKLYSYCQNLQAFVAMAVIKTLNENQAFRPTCAIHKKKQIPIYSQKLSSAHFVVYQNKYSCKYCLGFVNYIPTNTPEAILSEY